MYLWGFILLLQHHLIYNTLLFIPFGGMDSLTECHRGVYQMEHLAVPCSSLAVQWLNLDWFQVNSFSHHFATGIFSALYKPGYDQSVVKPCDYLAVLHDKIKDHFTFWSLQISKCILSIKLCSLTVLPVWIEYSPSGFLIMMQIFAAAVLTLLLISGLRK